MLLVQAGWFHPYTTPERARFCVLLRTDTKKCACTCKCTRMHYLGGDTECVRKQIPRGWCTVQYSTVHLPSCVYLPFFKNRHPHFVRRLESIATNEHSIHTHTRTLSQSLFLLHTLTLRLFFSFLIQNSKVVCM